MSIDHRAEAEEHLKVAAREFLAPEGDPTHALAAAQVHAALAAGETAAVDAAAYRHTIQSLRFALVRHIAEGLAFSKGDEAHLHARGLAKYLDSIGLNVDAEVDAYIDEHGEISSRDAWLSPTERKAKWDAEHPNPWDAPPF